MLQPPVPKSVKVAEAPGRGRSVLTHAPGSKGAEAYRELAEASRQPAKGRVVTERAATASGRRRALDPQGKRPCSRRPVDAAPDTSGPGDAEGGQGRALLDRSPPDRHRGRRVRGAAAAAPASRSPISVVRLVSISVWLPGRKNRHWMRCPACERTHWSPIDWTG